MKFTMNLNLCRRNTSIELRFTDKLLKLFLSKKIYALNSLTLYMFCGKLN